jgi:hypothetical protein
MDSFINSVFGSNPSKPININSTNKIANNVIDTAKNTGIAAVEAANVASTNLKDVGSQLQSAGSMLEKNSKVLANIVATAVDELKNTRTGNSIIQAGGSNASLLSVMPKSLILGGAHKFIRDTAKTLKQLGGNSTSAGNAIPSIIANAAKQVSSVINSTATVKNVTKLNSTLNNIAVTANNTANAANSNLGMNLPNKLNIAPLNTNITNNAKNAALSVVNVAVNLNKNKRNLSGGKYNRKTKKNRSRK